MVQTVFAQFQIRSRFGPDPVQTEVHGCPDQKIWTACPDMLFRFWTGPDHSGLVQTILDWSRANFSAYVDAHGTS